MSYVPFQQAIRSENGPWPTVRRPGTGCIVHLSNSIVPAGIEHTDNCKCIPVETEEQMLRLVVTAANALKEGIMDFEKPSIAFAMLLLGGEVVYDSKAK